MIRRIALRLYDKKKSWSVEVERTVAEVSFYAASSDRTTAKDVNLGTHYYTLLAYNTMELHNDQV